MLKIFREWGAKPQKFFLMNISIIQINLWKEFLFLTWGDNTVQVAM